MTRRGEGVGITITQWANAVLNNGLGRYERGARRGRDGPAPYQDELGLAAVGGAGADRGRRAHRRWPRPRPARYAVLAELTSACGTDWGLGVQARSQRAAERGRGRRSALYREAVTRLGRTRLRIDLARAHLLYGEWLRRERRRSDAREQLRPRHEMLQAMGVQDSPNGPGGSCAPPARPPAGGPRAGQDEELTAQEAQIARLARDGLSNPEIGTRLFISAHTVQYHLRKVFAKLGITSRSQLDRRPAHRSSPGASWPGPGLAPARRGRPADPSPVSPSGLTRHSPRAARAGQAPSYHP